MRTLIMTGRVVSDAKKECSKNGREYLSFRFANNEFGEKDSAGNPITYWFRVTSFQSNHFGLVQYLKKGKPLIITGRYSDSIYTNKSGATEISRDILVDTIEFQSSGENKTNGESAKPAGQTDVNTVPQVTNGGAPAVEVAPVSTQAPSTAPASGEEKFDDDLPF